MSKETAKKLIEELQTNEELKAKIAGITDPTELVIIAADAGYDVTVEEMAVAEKEYRAEQAHKTKLSVEELDAVAGGAAWKGEDAPDGHEMGCEIRYHHYSYQEETGTWCNINYYCEQNYEEHSSGHGVVGPV